MALVNRYAGSRGSPAAVAMVPAARIGDSPATWSASAA
jgi:hypothetical protein